MVVEKLSSSGQTSSYTADLIDYFAVSKYGYLVILGDGISYAGTNDWPLGRGANYTVHLEVGYIPQVMIDR